MSFDELEREINEAFEIGRQISEDLRAAEEREQAYARNRRTSPFLGAIITNAAIA